MKRLHVSLAVEDLEASIRFYSGLFGAEPSVLKSDYAKWLVEDPRVNFVVFSRGERVGLDHLGIQVENEDELGQVYARMRASGSRRLDQGEVTCCYAKMEKSWVIDPSGVAWEAFLTSGETTVYGDDTSPEELLARAEAADQACCSAATQG